MKRKKYYPPELETIGFQFEQILDNLRPSDPEHGSGTGDEGGEGDL